MAQIKNFEELEVWKLSMELCTEIYKLTNTELFSRDFVFAYFVRTILLNMDYLLK